MSKSVVFNLLVISASMYIMQKVRHKSEGEDDDNSDMSETEMEVDRRKSYATRRKKDNKKTISRTKFVWFYFECTQDVCISTSPIYALHNSYAQHICCSDSTDDKCQTCDINQHV